MTQVTRWLPVISNSKPERTKLKPAALTCITIIMIGATTDARAQSSVALYGVLDVGVEYTSNVSGKSVAREVVRHEPSFIGFQGKEDLGGGTKAIFQLEGTVTAPTGAGNTFNRMALVGLANDRYGSVLLGRQYDTMVDMVGVDPPRWNSVNAVHVGDYDRTAGVFVNNAVKYRTPNIGGFYGAALYSFGDVTSSTNTGRTVGSSINYVTDKFRLSASYLSINGVSHTPRTDIGIASLFGINFSAQPTRTIVSKDTIAGVGGYVYVGKMMLAANATQTWMEANRRTERLTTASGGVMLKFYPDFLPSMGYTYARMDGSHWNTVYGILDYFLSKRTDVYLRAVHQRASGANQLAALYVEGPSSNRFQTVVGVGMTTRF